MVAYERIFEIVFELKQNRLVTKWPLTRGGRLREVVAIAMRES